MDILPPSLLKRAPELIVRFPVAPPTLDLNCMVEDSDWKPRDWFSPAILLADALKVTSRSVCGPTLILLSVCINLLKILLFSI